MATLRGLQSLKRPADQSIESSELKKSKHNDSTVGVKSTPISEAEDVSTGDRDSSVSTSAVSPGKKIAAARSQRDKLTRTQDSTPDRAAVRNDNSTQQRALTAMEAVGLRRRVEELEARCRELQARNDDLEAFQQEDKRIAEDQIQQVEKLAAKAKEVNVAKDEARKMKKTIENLIKERDNAKKGWREMLDDLQDTRTKLRMAEQKAEDYRKKARIVTDEGSKEQFSVAAMPSMATSITHYNQDESVQDNGTVIGHLSTTSSSASPTADTISQPQSIQEHIDEGNHGTSDGNMSEIPQTTNQSPFLEKWFGNAGPGPSDTISPPQSTAEEKELGCGSNSVHNVPETERDVSNGGMSAKKVGKTPMYKLNATSTGEEAAEVSDSYDEERETEESDLEDEQEEDEIEGEQQDCHTHPTRPASIRIHIDTLNVHGNYIVGSTEQQIASAVLEAQSPGIEMFGQRPVNIENKATMSGPNNRSEHKQNDGLQAFNPNGRVHTSTDRFGDAHTGMDASPNAYNYCGHEGRDDTTQFLEDAGFGITDTSKLGQVPLGNQDDVHDMAWVTESSSSDSDVAMTQVGPEHMDHHRLDKSLDEIIEEDRDRQPPRGPKNTAQHSRRGPNRPNRRPNNRSQPARTNGRNVVQGRTSPIETRSRTNRRGAAGRGEQHRPRGPGPADTGRRPTTRNTDAGMRKPANNRQRGGRPDVRERSPSPPGWARQNSRPQRHRGAGANMYVGDQHGEYRSTMTGGVIDHYASNRDRESRRREAVKAQRASNEGGHRIRR